MTFSICRWNARRKSAARCSGTQTEIWTIPACFFLSRYASDRFFAAFCSFKARAARASFWACVIPDISSVIGFIFYHQLRDFSYSSDVKITQYECDKNVANHVSNTFVDSLHKFNFRGVHPHPPPKLNLFQSACRRLDWFGVHPHLRTSPHKLRLCFILPGKEHSCLNR